MASKIALTGLQKAAMLLISLGPERSATILTSFDEDDIERLTREISTMRVVVPEVQAELFAECYSRIGSGREALAGGHEYARDMLVRALGERKATELLERIFSNRIAPFVFMGDGDPLQIANFLRDEHPQTVAVVLSHLRARQAAAVLANFEPELQSDIAVRIAKMDPYRSRDSWADRAWASDQVRLGVESGLLGIWRPRLPGHTAQRNRPQRGKGNHRVSGKHRSSPC